MLTEELQAQSVGIVQAETSEAIAKLRASYTGSSVCFRSTNIRSAIHSPTS
jgi:hypothetical protein